MNCAPVMNNNATLSRTISSNSSSSCCGGGDISDHDRVASNTTSQQILSTILKRSRSSVISGTVVADATSITLAEWNSFLMNVLNPHKLWRHVASPTTTSTPVLASDRDTTTLTGAGAPTTTHTSNQVIDSTGRNNTNTTGENTQHDDQGQHDPEIDTVAAEEEAHAEHPDCFKCRKELVAFLQQHNCPPDAAYPSSTTQEVPLQLAVNRYNPIPDCVAWLAQAAPEMVHQRDPASGLLPIETLGRYIVIKEEMNRYSHNSNLLRAVTEKRSTTDDNWECVRVLAVYYSHRYRHYRRRQTTQTTCMPLPPRSIHVWQHRWKWQRTSLCLCWNWHYADSSTKPPSLMQMDTYRWMLFYPIGYLISWRLRKF